MTNPNTHPYDDGVLLEDMESVFPESKPEVPAAPDPTGDRIAALADSVKVLADRSAPPAPETPRYTPPAPAPEPVYNREAILGMLEEGKTLEAMEALVGYTYLRAQRDLDARIQPLTGTASSIAEQSARAKYADEFALFGSDIASLSTAAGATMAQPGAWDNLISFVRGKEGNFEKLVEHKSTNRSRATTLDNVAPSISAGALRGGGPPPNNSGKPTREQLSNDPDVRKVLAASGMSLDDYIRWYN